MSLSKFLQEQKLTSALIIDDGYDEVPKASDLSRDVDEWTFFMDDVGEGDEVAIVGLFPAYAQMDGPALMHSDDFVRAMWNAKAAIRQELWERLFSSYVQSRTADQTFLGILEKRLSDLGLSLTKSGREITNAGKDAAFIFADLYLGAGQQEDDIDKSIARLKPVLEARASDPPLVVLMSRSPHLDSKKASFRDKAQLIGALFRAYEKSDLIDGANLERAVERLAMHRPDAVKVAAFLESWKSGLNGAAERFLDGVRRLDLSDYGQIGNILLQFEGQPLGSYLLDVFDRIYHHEMEGDTGIIAAANSLSSIDPSSYPAPHIDGSSDLQDFVYRTVWQNPKRLAIKSTNSDMPVSFGDVLCKKALLNGSTEDDAFRLRVVLTPPCDLVRTTPDTRVLLMEGKASELKPSQWSYKGKGPTTPIAIIGDRRFHLQWNTKALRISMQEELAKELAQEQGWSVVLRLRDDRALDLQQKTLVDMSRVGLTTHMPGTFAVNVEVFFWGTDDALHPITAETIAKEGGVCYVGRTKTSEENTTVVLTEPAIDELLLAVSALTDAEVNERARAALALIKTGTSLAGDLQRGLGVPSHGQPGFQQLKVTALVQGVSKEVVIGYVGRNPTIDKPTSKDGVLVLKLTDK